MPTLEFTLDPADLRRLFRLQGMGRPGRPVPVHLVWHDTPESALAQHGWALLTTPRSWRLEHLRAITPAEPPCPIAEATTRTTLAASIPDNAAPVIAFQGERRRLVWTGEPGQVILRSLTGRLSSRRAPPLCRLTLQGPAPALQALAPLLARELRLAVPRATLSAQALAAANGTPLPARALGGPKVPKDVPLADGLSVILGHLLDTLLHWADQAPLATTPEPVHQMRVASRRLRAALSLAALSLTEAATPDQHRAPATAALVAPTRLLATCLGAARDWDVFLEHTGARLAKAFPEDPRCTAMLRAAARRRRTAYTAVRSMLESPDFRALTTGLALATALRPWAEPGAPGQDPAIFAATALAKRARRVRKAGKQSGTLPVPALHELRKDCKRLRYTAEFFASLFPEKPTARYLKRLAALQEELGLLNDTAAIASLMAQLGRADRGYAAGLVEGFCTASAAPARARIVRAWKRFAAAEPFWTE